MKKNNYTNSYWIFFHFFLSNFYSNRRKRKKIEGVLFYSNNKNMTSNKSGVVDLSKFKEIGMDRYLSYFL